MCLSGNSLELQLGGVYLFILPKGPVRFAVALFVFSPCRYPKAELRTYQSISVVKRDLSAGRAAGISQVGVGVVDGESTQTWQGDRDTAEAVSGGRTERGTAGVQALAHSGAARARRGAAERWERLGRGDICWHGTERRLCPATLPGPRAQGTQIRLSSTLWAFPLHYLPGEGKSRCMRQQRTRRSEG